MITKSEFEKEVNKFVESKKFDDLLKYFRKILNNPDYQTKKQIQKFIFEWESLKKAPYLKIMDENQIKISYTFFLKDELPKFFNELTDEKFSEIHIPDKEVNDNLNDKTNIISEKITVIRIFFETFIDVSVWSIIFGFALFLMKFTFAKILFQGFEFQYIYYNFFDKFFILFLLSSITFLNKDIFKGRGIGKRVLKLQIIDKKTKKMASPLKCFLRNMFVLIYPLDFIVLAITKKRFLSDLILNTEFTNYSKDNYQIHSLMNYVLTIILSTICSITIISIFYVIYPNYT